MVQQKIDSHPFFVFFGASDSRGANSDYFGQKRKIVMKTSFQKKYYAAAVLLISTIAGVFYATEVSAAWPTTTATRCWSIAPESLVMQARITPTGGGFSTLNILIVKNGSIHNIGSGTAYVRGKSVYMTVDHAGKDSVAMWTGQEYAVLDKKTLIGESESIGHDYNYDDSSLDTQYGSGVFLTPVPCTSLWQ